MSDFCEYYYELDELYEELFGEGAQQQDGLGTKTNIKKKKKCECGAEKAKTTHSDWCPKYDRK